MNRSKPNQLLKIEKENENKDIRRRLKAVQPKVYTGTTHHTMTTSNIEKMIIAPSKPPPKIVATSKANNVESIQGGSYAVPPKSRIPTYSIEQIANLEETSENYVKALGIIPHHKPLSPYLAPTVSTKPRLGKKPMKSPSKTAFLSSIESTDNKVEEILTFTARNEYDRKQCSERTRYPKTPIADNSNNVQQQSISRMKITESTELGMEVDCGFSGDSSTCLNLDLDQCSLTSRDVSNDVYFVAPMLSIPSATVSQDSTGSIIRNFRNTFELEELSIAEEEIKVVKVALRTDERHSQLRKENADPKLFQDILKTKLEEIVRNEQVIKNVLHKLGAEVDENEKEYVNKNRSSRKAHKTERSSSRRRSRKRSSRQFNQISERSTTLFNRLSGEKHDVAISVQSLNNSSPRYYHRYSYPENISEKMSNHKEAILSEALDPQDEYEEFLNNTLPLKRRNHNRKAITQVGYVRELVQGDIRSALKEDDEKSRQKLERKPQIDVTFKNVPSLEKEILILKALGERLEATLKRTLSEPSLSGQSNCKELCPAISTLSLSKEMRKIDSSIKIYPGRCVDSESKNFTEKSVVQHFVTGQQVVIQFEIFSMGIRHEIGVVNEYLIMPKTIDELKSNASLHFYLPKNIKDGQLECTSYEKLIEKPDILLRHLKPKNTSVSFNVLDHDVMFFNSLLLPSLKSMEKIEKKRIPLKLEFLNTADIYESVDSTKNSQCEISELTSLSISSEIPKEQPNELVKEKVVEKTIPISTDNVEVIKQQPSTPPSQNVPEAYAEFTSPTIQTSTKQLSDTRRRRIRRNITPMPLDAYDQPKNHLFKTILVGVVQVSVFLLMIMAITYPDIKC